MTLAVEDVSTKNVDIVAVADGGGEETIDDRLVTVDNSATASKKLLTVWLPVLIFCQSLDCLIVRQLLWQNHSTSGPLCLGRCLHIGWVSNLMGFVRQRAGRRSAPILVISGQ